MEMWEALNISSSWRTELLVKSSRTWLGNFSEAWIGHAWFWALSRSMERTFLRDEMNGSMSGLEVANIGGKVIDS